MINLFKEFSQWLIKQFEPIFEFFKNNRNNAFLWIGLFLVGVLITKFTYDVLNRGKEQ